MKRKDLTGQTFGWLFVNEEIGTKTIGKSQTKRTLWDCICICGNHVEVTTNDLTSGRRVSCGCKRSYNAQEKIISEVGNVHNYLYVKEEAGRDKYGRISYLCVCLRCGNEIIVSGKNLRNESVKSCGCLKEEFGTIYGGANFRDLEGQQFGYLLVKNRAETKFSERGNPSTMWNCICLLCGREVVVAAGALTTNNHTRSCGCLKMSYREKEIHDILQAKEINFRYNYSFKDLLSPTSNYPLSFDFALLDDNNKLLCLIEHQGQQHYEKYANGFGDFQREVTDPMKRQYCKKNNIILYEISYEECIPERLDLILSQTYNLS